MKLNKSYYQYLIEDLSKALLKEKNRLAQILDTEFKEDRLSRIYETNELDIIITFKKKENK